MKELKRLINSGIGIYRKLAAPVRSVGLLTWSNKRNRAVSTGLAILVVLLSVRVAFASTSFNQASYRVFNNQDAAAGAGGWSQTTHVNNWPGRSGFVTLNFNNKIWIMGGSSLGASELNDVWSSSDGVTWTEVTASAAWTGRESFSGAVFNNKMWIMGGIASGTYVHDVWSSSDGITWTQATSAAAWVARSDPQTLSYNSKLWIMGGQNVSGTTLHDVYSSSDGATWTQATNAAAWSARSGLGAAVLNSKMWVYGGMLSAGTDAHDVYSSTDGVTWTQATSAAGWAARETFTSFAYNSKLWAMGGYVSGTGYAQDVWSSSDGITWTQATSAASWGARTYAGAATVGSSMVVLGGYDSFGSHHNDAWSTTDGATWTEISGNGAPWTTRYGAVTLNYNNKLWIMGGYDANDGIEEHDVWSSSDGVTWTQATSAAAWAGRDDFVGMVFNNKMWIMGGLTSTEQHDVWSSSDGITWTQATSAAGWSARAYFTGSVYNSKMWIMGGNNTSLGQNYHDVWSSSDGITWTQATSAAAWSARYGLQTVTYNSAMYMIGGSGSGGNLSDVWSSTDGASWTQVKANQSGSQWAQRFGFLAVVYNSKLWILGGFDDTNYYNDVWSSSDGATWTQDSASVGWQGRQWPSGTVFNNQIWIMSGQYEDMLNLTYYYLNDVWTYAATSSIDVSTPLAAQNTAALAPAVGTPFRVRMDIGVSTTALGSGGQSFKLQYAQLSGTCATTPTGNFADVTDTSTIGYYDNSVATNGIALTTDANDPTDGSNTLIYQTYQEKATTTFANSAAISTGQDGIWDFALVENSPASDAHYCLRMVTNTGGLLNTYTQYPEIISPILAPTLNAPGSSATGVSVTPQFQLRTTDASGNYLQYKIFLYQSNCSTAVGSSPFDQSSNQTGWSGQDANGGTAYAGSGTITSSTMATYIYQGTLSTGTTYCWKAEAKAPAVSANWSPDSATQFFTTSFLPNAPTLLAPPSGQTGLTTAPQLRLSSTDPDKDYLEYWIQICSTSNCSSVAQNICQTNSGSNPPATCSSPSQAGWSSQSANSGAAYQSGQAAVYTIQTPLSANTQYWWRAYAIDPAGTNTWSSASSISTFNTQTSANPPSVHISGGNINIGGNVTIKP